MTSNLKGQTLRFVSTCLLVSICVGSGEAQQPQPKYCGDEGVWVQTLGSGDLDLDNDRGAESYVVWLDQRALLLVNAGSGTAVRFDQSNANFADLQAIVLTQTSVNQTADIPALLAGSRRAYREEPLTILGPTGDETWLATSTFIDRLLSEDGPFPHLAPLLTIRSPNGYQIRTRDVTAIGSRRWSEFGSQDMMLSAIPVKHGDIPTLAWRIDIGPNSIVFALGMNNQKDTLTKFAKEADAIVFSHALPVGTVGTPRDKYLIPREIGRIASSADARFIIMGGRSWRTLGREARTVDEVETHYDGTIIFPEDLECWGL